MGQQVFLREIADGFSEELVFGGKGGCCRHVRFIIGGSDDRKPLSGLVGELRLGEQILVGGKAAQGLDLWRFVA